MWSIEEKEKNAPFIRRVNLHALGPLSTTIASFVRLFNKLLIDNGITHKAHDVELRRAANTSGKDVQLTFRCSLPDDKYAALIEHINTCSQPGPRESWIVMGVGSNPTSLWINRPNGTYAGFGGCGPLHSGWFVPTDDKGVHFPGIDRDSACKSMSKTRLILYLNDERTVRLMWDDVHASVARSFDVCIVDMNSMTSEIVDMKSSRPCFQFEYNRRMQNARKQVYLLMNVLHDARGGGRRIVSSLPVTVIQSKVGESPRLRAIQHMQWPTPEDWDKSTSPKQRDDEDDVQCVGEVTREEKDTIGRKNAVVLE